ncbi:MAG: hypothetical protein QI197_04635 [Candidatus Korarchaeota archaeon]|nr:hypothetical protein [Candidatus Korarchaeota archaeon]
MVAEEYGTFVVLLGVVIGVGSRQILVKAIWEGESPINVEEAGIDLERGGIDVKPGDFVKAMVKVIERRIPREGADLDPPMVPGGEREMKLVSIRKITPAELSEELSKISEYIYSIHFRSNNVIRFDDGGGEVEDSGDWTWVRGSDGS